MSWIYNNVEYYISQKKAMSFLPLPELLPFIKISQGFLHSKLTTSLLVLFPPAPPQKIQKYSNPLLDPFYILKDWFVDYIIYYTSMQLDKM